DDEAVLRACANIQNVTLINADLVNVYDLAANTKCIFTVDAANKIQSRFEEVCE
ncbi:MAG: 50S ribosomal protein L4, partial [Clostridia bacterium]|nr:50S ribosomal protein L4 [Clostridia bacterium]